MHILFLTDNFPPEGNAPATRTYEHAREWVAAGHKVTVITCAPNFPDGVVFDGYQNKWHDKSVIDGIEVHRVKTYITANEGFSRRILDYLSFMVMSFICGLFIKKPDIIVATSPQFFTAVAGWSLSACRRKPFVFELRDIWPASITAVGAMKKSQAILWLEKLEMFLYKKASRIVAVTQSFKQELTMRGIDANKIDVVINGVNMQQYQPRSKPLKLAMELGVEDKFVVGYLGTHGMAHCLENILDTAERLRTYPNVHFLFAGGGACLGSLKDQVRERKLDNVKILGRQPKSMMPDLLALCDVSLLHLKDNPVFNGVIPSKMFEAMGMGIPMVCAVPEGEATGIIERNNCGLVVAPENPEQLAAAILRLSDSAELHQELASASAAAAAEYDRKKLADKMLAVLEDVCGTGNINRRSNR